jgi:hypothetical protein
MLMDPNNLPPTQPYIPKQNVNYDFIMQANKKQRRFSFGGKDSKVRLLIKDNVAQLSELAAEQQEIVRIANLGIENAVGAETKNLAITTKLSVASQHEKLLDYLKDRKHKITKEQLAAKKDTSVDKALREAREENNYDSVFKEVIKEDLASYATNLEKSYQSATSTKAKNLLSESYDSTQNLLK